MICGRAKTVGAQQTISMAMVGGSNATVALSRVAVQSHPCSLGVCPSEDGPVGTATDDVFHGWADLDLDDVPRVPHAGKQSLALAV